LIWVIIPAVAAQVLFWTLLVHYGDSSGWLEYWDLRLNSLFGTGRGATQP
jgi:hypothetical protein